MGGATENIELFDPVFRLRGSHETKNRGRRNHIAWAAKTSRNLGTLFRERWEAINRAETARQGTVMIKAISAIAVAAFVAAAFTLLPGFAPQVEASVPVALAKSDRLDVRPAGRDCSQQAWPNFEASCLRSATIKAAPIREARLVTAERR
jgi:hypothetical protein